MYTIHYNEPPIGKFNGVGRPKFRTCYRLGRLYESLDDLVKAPSKEESEGVKRKYPRNYRKGGSTIITCPRCHDSGRVNWYRPEKDKPEKKYYVEHGIVPGTWGAERHPRHKRCYINNANQKKIEAILKSLNT
jgi:hypothetical protein